MIGAFSTLIIAKWNVLCSISGHSKVQAIIMNIKLRALCMQVHTITILLQCLAKLHVPPPMHSGVVISHVLWSVDKDSTGKPLD